MDQPGKVANSARGQLKRENEYFPVPVRAREFGLARQVRLSRPASACSFSTVRLNLVFAHGIPPDFRGGVHLSIPPSAIGSVPSLSGHAIACRWSSLPKFCRPGSVVLKVVPVTGAAFSGFTMDQFMCVRLSFTTPNIIFNFIFLCTIFFKEKSERIWTF